MLRNIHCSLVSTWHNGGKRLEDGGCIRSEGNYSELLPYFRV